MDVIKNVYQWHGSHRKMRAINSNLIDETMMKYEEPTDVCSFLGFARDQRILSKRIDDINKLGVVGERGTIAMYLAVIDSRLNLHDTALALKNSGRPGSGKSFVLQKCLKLFPEEAYIYATGASEKSLYHLPGGVQFRCIIMNEAKGLGNLNDSNLAYSIRSLISEGILRYFVTDTSGDGVDTIPKVQKGPISFITTTNLDSLEPQIDDRLFAVHPDESTDQILRVVKQQAISAAGTGQKHEVDLDMWRFFHKCLKPVEVRIPFAEIIYSAIFEPQPKFVTVPTLMRSFGRLLTLIKAVAVLHQFQRNYDKLGRLMAQIEDYYMAKQMAEKIMVEDLSNHTPVSRRRLELIQQLGQCSMDVLVVKEGVTKQAISDWAGKLVKSNTLIWVDQAGNSFSSKKNLETAKSSGKAFIRLADSGQGLFSLPDPWEITDSKSWKPDGDLTAMFDLNLSGQPVKCEPAQRLS